MVFIIIWAVLTAGHTQFVSQLLVFPLGFISAAVASTLYLVQVYVEKDHKWFQNKIIWKFTYTGVIKTRFSTTP